MGKMSMPFGFGEKVAVLSDDLIKKSIEEQAPEHIRVYKGNSGAKDKDVLSLRLDFQKILKIENLWSFTSLTHLQLDNNLIESIEGLDELVNLEWLDLSFNSIEKLEGLSKLTKLRDLSVHHNSIQCIENLDELKDLEVLSIGDNLLPSLEDAPIVYLRRFRRLRCLNLAGNPLCEDAEYEAFVVAHLPDLKFLDYRRVAEDTRKAALIKYQDKLEVINAKEEDELAELEAKAKLEAKLKLHRDSCVPELEGADFFNCVLDPSIRSMAELPAVAELLQTFEDKFVEKTSQLLSFGLAKAEERAKEREELVAALKDGIKDVSSDGADLVHKFITKKQEVLASIENGGIGALAYERVEHLVDELSEIRDTLFEMEIDFVSEIEQTLSRFERNYKELVGVFTEQCQATFTDLREMEEETVNEISTAAMLYIDSVAKGEADGMVELSDEALEVMRDKTALSTAIASAHDNHLMEIDNKEDDILGLAKKEVAALMDRLHADEAKRNRERVSEICRFHDFHNKELQHILEDL